MAKLKAPLFSKEVRGTLGGALTFSTRKIVKQVRYQRKQTDRITPTRTTQRDLFKLGVDWWHQLTTDEQDEWDAIARYDC